MSQPSKRVVLISPEDVDAEIEAIRGVIQQANQLQDHGRLAVWHWRTDATPGVHLQGAQGLADDQMKIAEADLVVAVFWCRLGTPVFDERSGTAHELRLALKSWKLTGKPDVWVYFCIRDIPQQALEDPNQYPALQQFKGSLPTEVVHFRFRNSDELHRDFTKHLGAWLQRNQPAASGALTQPQGVLVPPDASRTVPRPQQADELAAAFRSTPIVCLCGISGSGKTRLAAQYVVSGKRLDEHRNGPLWYDVSDGDTLDEMLAVLPAEYVGAEDLSALARCKNLLTTLRLRGQLLVLDDFHRADRISFAPLLRVAGMQSVPGCILLLSRTVLYIADSTDVAVRAWNIHEVKRLITELGVPTVAPPLLQTLTQRTGGLPLAIKFFAVLVKELGYNARHLLDGPLPPTEQIDSWYAEIKSQLDEAHLVLLRYLSLAEPYITEPVLRRAQTRLAQPDRSRTFVRLQTLMLVEVRGSGRWAVHPFVAEHILNDTDADTTRQLLRDLCDFSRAGIQYGRPSDITYASLAAGIRACRYAQRAGDVEQSAAIVNLISSAAKKLGLYGALRDLCQWQVTADPTCDPWIRYHLAHCEMILGNIRAAITILTLLHRHTHTLPSPLVFASARILAESRAQAGDVETAVRELRQVVGFGPPTNRKGRGATVAYRQAKATLAHLLIKNRQIEEARDIAGELARTTKDDRTLAVLTMILGLSERDRSARSAEQRFRGALALFRSSADRRGAAWAERNLAETILGRRNEGGSSAEARRHIREAISIHSRTGELTAEYGEWLERVRSAAGDDVSTANLLDQELIKLSRDVRAP